MNEIGEIEGRCLFGLDVVEYDQVRPPYPDSVYSLLVKEAVLYPGAATLEIGPGSGIATRRLIEAGANPIILIEPDVKFHEPLLRLARLPTVHARLLTTAFEDAELESGCFDLVVAATAFHWLDPHTRVEKMAELLRPGGNVVLVWNLFQDTSKSDDFHEATKHLLSRLATSPSAGANTLPFGLDRVRRESEFCGRGLFELGAYAEIHWALELDSSQVRALYQSFSSIARLPESERNHLLDEIFGIAAAQFQGRVIRNMTTPLYLFRRQSTD